jgi:hypothetical protein
MTSAAMTSGSGKLALACFAVSVFLSLPSCHARSLGEGGSDFSCSIDRKLCSAFPYSSIERFNVSTHHDSLSARFNDATF